MKEGCHVAEFLVPYFAETTDKRLFQKLIEGKVKCLPFCYGILTDFPTVIVQPYKSALKMLLTDGIERTTDGLDKW